MLSRLFGKKKSTQSGLNLSGFVESKFGNLWIDEDAVFQKNLDKLPADIAPHISEMHDKGYTILKGAVAHDIVDQIVADKERIYSEPERFVLKNKGNYMDPIELTKLDRADRIVDLYAVSEAAREAIGAPMVTRILKMIFQDDPIAMQSIFFEYGSQQSIHQDTAYVISSKPLKLAAAWIALEDIAPGSGELIYYPGSHRFKHYLFSGEHKNWTPARDGKEQHQEFLLGLHEQARAAGVEAESFLAKKGDILIWHADLAHGGSQITVPDRTRLSLVAHYCPRQVKPTYKKHIEKQYVEHESPTGMFFTFRHYDLRPMENGGDPTLLYDGGVTKRRHKAKGK